LERFAIARTGLRRMRNSCLHPKPVSKRQSKWIAVTCVIWPCCGANVQCASIQSSHRFEMLTIKHSRARVSIGSWCRIAIVVLAVFSLTASVATRYVSLGDQVQNVATVKSQSPDAHRQRLLSNAVQWTAPAASLTLFQPPRSSVFAVSVVVPSTNLSSESWLYNRPPPTC
jgi:hypothetical protein